MSAKHISAVIQTSMMNTLAVMVASGQFWRSHFGRCGPGTDAIVVSGLCVLLSNGSVMSTSPDGILHPNGFSNTQPVTQRRQARSAADPIRMCLPPRAATPPRRSGFSTDPRVQLPRLALPARDNEAQTNPSNMTKQKDPGTVTKIPHSPEHT